MGDIVVAVCYKTPGWEDQMDKPFYSQPEVALCLQAVVLLRKLNNCWKKQQRRAQAVKGIFLPCKSNRDNKERCSKRHHIPQQRGGFEDVKVEGSLGLQWPWQSRVQDPERRAKGRNNFGLWSDMLESVQGSCRHTQKVQAPAGLSAYSTSFGVGDSSKSGLCTKAAPSSVPLLCMAAWCSGSCYSLFHSHRCKEGARFDSVEGSQFPRASLMASSR